MKNEDRSNFEKELENLMVQTSAEENVNSVKLSSVKNCLAKAAELFGDLGNTAIETELKDILENLGDK